MLPASRSARLAALGLLATVAAAAAVFLLRAPDSGAGGALGAPLLVLGLITDAQYADIPDAVSAWKVPRCYRYSIEVVRAAVAAWAAVAPSDGGVSAVVHLGDAVDGNAGQGPGGAIGALDVVSAAFAALGRPVRFRAAALVRARALTSGRSRLPGALPARQPRVLQLRPASALLCLRHRARA